MSTASWLDASEANVQDKTTQSGIPNLRSRPCCGLLRTEEQKPNDESSRKVVPTDPSKPVHENEVTTLSERKGEGGRGTQAQLLKKRQ